MIRRLVLDQSDNLRSPLKELPFGMRGLWAPTLAALDRRGLLRGIAASQPDCRERLSIVSTDRPDSTGRLHWAYFCVQSDTVAGNRRETAA